MDEYMLETVPNKETPLFYSAKPERDRETGCLGHMRMDFGRGGDGFWHTWFDHCSEWITPSFKSELNGVINSLIEKGVLTNLSSMASYCYNHPQARLNGGRENNYGFKVQTDSHVYYLRCCTTQGDYNLYCYAYERGKLEKALWPAAQNALENEKLKAVEQKYGKDSFEYEYVKNEVSLTLGEYTEVLGHLESEFSNRGYVLKDGNHTAQDYLNDYIENVDVRPFSSDCKRIADYIISHENRTTSRPAAKQSLMDKVEAGRQKAARRGQPDKPKNKKTEVIE